MPKPKAKPTRELEFHPTREEIEQRAYQLYVQRGGATGSDVEDWLQAERELREKYDIAKAATA